MLHNKKYSGYRPRQVVVFRFRWNLRILIDSMDSVHFTDSWDLMDSTEFIHEAHRF